MGIRNRFSLDLGLIYRLLESIPEGGLSAPQTEQQFPELGGEKARGLREWANNLGLTFLEKQRTYTSALGEAALLTRHSPLETKIQEIMYYKLATSHDLEVFSTLVNGFLFDVARTFDRVFQPEEARRPILDMVATDANPKYVQGEIGTAVRALTSEQGLGKLGIVVPTAEGHYRVNSYPPDWRSAAYMIYDSWPENVARVEVSEVVSGQNGLGRIFFLPERQVLALLVRLEQERAIALEIVADLSQIGLNPAMKAADFLEMLIHDQS